VEEIDENLKDYYDDNHGHASFEDYLSLSIVRWVAQNFITVNDTSYLLFQTHCDDLSQI
jgi:hypothetical protein